MARTYLCPHCGAKNKFRPGDADDGVVTCPSCREPFIIPDAAGPKHSDTALIDARGVRPVVAPPERPKNPQASKHPTVLVPDSQRPAPSRARTILLPERGMGDLSSSATQPVDPSVYSHTVPGYDTVGGTGRPLRVTIAIALGLVAAGLTWVSAIGGSAPLDGGARTRATTVAAGISAVMTAGRPDLARLLLRDTEAQVVRRDGSPAFGGGHAVYAPVLARVCKDDSAVVRAFLGAPDPILEELGPKRCGATWTDAAAPAKTALPGLAEKIQAGTLEWTVGEEINALAPIGGGPVCASCHGETFRSGTVAHVHTRTTPAGTGSSAPWLWATTAGLAVLGGALFLALRAASAPTSAE